MSTRSCSSFSVLPFSLSSSFSNLVICVLRLINVDKEENFVEEARKSTRQPFSLELVHARMQIGSESVENGRGEEWWCAVPYEHFRLIVTKSDANQELTTERRLPPHSFACFLQCKIVYKIFASFYKKYGGILITALFTSVLMRTNCWGGKGGLLLEKSRRQLESSGRKRRIKWIIRKVSFQL